MSSTAAKLKDEGNALFNEKGYESAIEKDSATMVRPSLSHVSALSAVQSQNLEIRGDGVTHIAVTLSIVPLTHRRP